MSDGKPGRPPTVGRDGTERRLTVRLSEEDHAVFEAVAKILGDSKVEVIRRLAWKGKRKLVKFIEGD